MGLGGELGADEAEVVFGYAHGDFGHGTGVRRSGRLD
jgi:hypothetical protein